MKDYGTVISDFRPRPIEIQDLSVIICYNIKEFQHTMNGITTTLYEYHQCVYDKDEYIIMVSTSTLEAIKELQDELDAIKMTLGVT